MCRVKTNRPARQAKDPVFLQFTGGVIIKWWHLTCRNVKLHLKCGENSEQVKIQLTQNSGYFWKLAKLSKSETIDLRVFIWNLDRGGNTPISRCNLKAALFYDFLKVTKFWDFLRFFKKSQNLGFYFTGGIMSTFLVVA